MRRSKLTQGCDHDDTHEGEYEKLTSRFEKPNNAKIVKHFAGGMLYVLLSAAWHVFCVGLLIAIVATAIDIYPTWKIASRMVEVDVAKAQGTLASSTCKYYAKQLDEKERAKWEASALAETNVKCVEADIVNNQYPIIMKLRRVAYHYLPWESGEFWVFVKDALAYAVCVMLPVLASASKLVEYFSPIIRATNTAPV